MKGHLLMNLLNEFKAVDVAHAPIFSLVASIVLLAQLDSVFKLGHAVLAMVIGA